MRTHFQTIVVGAGAIGSATAYWLALRGQRDVLVVEQYELGHGHGSSNDHHRIIRHSYHSNAYGALTRAMYDNWEALQQSAGQNVFVKTGGLDIAVEGTPGIESLERYRAVMRDSGVTYDELTRESLLDRFPQWNIPEDEVRATYQEETGFIDIRRATATHITLAQNMGVTVLDQTPARAIESATDGVRVVTDDAVFTAEKVVVCAASWTDDLLKPLGQTWSTTITEEQVVYVRPKDLGLFSIDRFPVWVWHGADFTYGFPTYGEVATKIARENLSRIVTQHTRQQDPHPDETDYLLRFLEQRLPQAAGNVVLAKTCPYDLTPDRDFILDSLPGHPNVIVGAGAAHAGKFCGLLGEILSELVVSGRSKYPIGAFRADRPALTDPTLKPAFNLRG